MNYLKVNSGGGKILKLVIILAIYGLIITGGTYAYLKFDAINNDISGQAMCSDIYYQSDNIKASNLSVTDNYLEGAKTTITLSYQNDCDIYDKASIYIHTDDNITIPIENSQALKYKIFQKNTFLTEGVISEKGDLLLATVPLTENLIDYKIYLWIDSSIANTDFDNTIYSGYIYATSEQTSTLNNNVLVTYDYNYLINNTIDNYYDTSMFYPCCDSGSNLVNSSISMEDGTKLYQATMNTPRGWYFVENKALTAGKTYTYSFWAKASDNVIANIGSEQGGYKAYNISTSWQRYTNTFKATSKYHDDESREYKAFIFYDWWNGIDDCTLQIKDLQFQEGKANNITISYNNGDKINQFPNAVRKNYEFLGWYTAPISGELVTNDLALTSNATYYAHWKYNGN